MYSSHYLFLLMAAYFLFLRRSHHDYESERIFSPEERLDFVTRSNRASREVVQPQSPMPMHVYLRALRIIIVSQLLRIS